MAPIFTGPVVSQRQENSARTRRTDACQRLKGPWVRGRRGQAWRDRDAEAAQRKVDGRRYFACNYSRSSGPLRFAVRTEWLVTWSAGGMARQQREGRRRRKCSTAQ